MHQSATEAQPGAQTEAGFGGVEQLGSLGKALQSFLKVLN